MMSLSWRRMTPLDFLYGKWIIEMDSHSNFQAWLQQSDSSNAEYDVEFLRSCKKVQYCRSENGNPFLSIHRGKGKYPTPIAYRTQTRSKLGTTHAHHVPHAEHVERWDEMVKRSRDDVEDFEDVSGTPCCPPPVLFTAQWAKLSHVFNGQNYL